MSKDLKKVKPVEEMTDQEILTMFRNDHSKIHQSCNAIFESSQSFKAGHLANRSARTAMVAMGHAVRRGFTLKK